MRRKKSLIICILLLTVLLIFTINYIKNITLYRLKAEIKDEFNIVKGFDVSYYGPYCDISVYLEKGNYEYTDIEPIFIKMMIELDNKDIIKYLQDRHEKKENSELAFLSICFYKGERTKDMFLYEFSSYKDFETWKLETWMLGIEKDVKYNVSDYK